MLKTLLKLEFSELKGGGETKGLDISYNVLITFEYVGVEKIYLVTHWSLIQLYPHVSKSCVKCVREWGQN